MQWTAIVPIKPLPERKSRLSGCLPAEQRQHLSERMFRHVVGTLLSSPDISSVVVLSKCRPSILGVRWLADGGNGLNPELTRATGLLQRPSEQGLDEFGQIVVHADLPGLTTRDIRTVLETARRNGVAIAPDRAGTGTNAIAYKGGRPLQFAFGEDSCAAHLAQVPVAGMVTRRVGLEVDVDRPADLDLAVRLHLLPDRPPG